MKQEFKNRDRGGAPLQPTRHTGPRAWRFEKLRLKEPGYTQAVEIRDCEYLVES